MCRGNVQVDWLERSEQPHRDVKLVDYFVSIMVLDLHNKVSRFEIQNILGVVKKNLLVPIWIYVSFYHY